jgi:predicted MFS family arabinose efflux permease
MSAAVRVQSSGGVQGYHAFVGVLVLASSQSSSRPAKLILVLSLAAAIGIGVARFGYALVLPDMRDSLHWSYSAAGFVGTMNAAGYLAGALVAPRLLRRFGWTAAVHGGTLACIASLALCATSGNFVLLSIARLIAGFGAAAAFIAGGGLAANIAQSQPQRASFLLSLFYAGPGIGILASGLVAPFALQAFGPGSWWIAWCEMTALGALLALPVLLMQFDLKIGNGPAPAAAFQVAPVANYLAGYFLFGAGYIAYMTFMIALVRDAGGGAAAQAGFWGLVGISTCLAPWVWRRVLAFNRGGLATSIMIAVSAVGAMLPMFGHSAPLLASSAVVFGVAFFAVVGSSTAFVRLNYPPSAWPTAIAAMTSCFGIGQTLGPIVVGVATDALGNLGYALNVSAGMLAAAALSTLAQGRLHGDATASRLRSLHQRQDTLALARLQQDAQDV